MRLDGRRPCLGLAVRLALVLVLASATGFTSGCVHATFDHPTSESPVVSSGDCHRVETARFAFYSDPWINLHLFLFQWARNVPQRQPGDRRPVVEVPETRQLGHLGANERSAWEQAVRFYRERLVSRDLVHDRDLIALRDPLATIACDGGTPEDIDADLRAVLLGAMPVYRRHWWPRHLARNLKWIDQLVQTLEPYEKTLASRLADAYGGEWPAERIRVDVTAYASWQGDYTTNRPNQITMESDADVKGLTRVDLLFHEASHASYFEQPLLREVSEAFRAHGAEPPDGLVHVIQFVTPPELIRQLLHGRDLRRFQPFATELFRIYPEWDRFRRILVAHWLPFLEGRLGRDEALDQVADALAKTDTASEMNHAHNVLAGDGVCTFRIDPGHTDAGLRARLARP